MTDDVVVNARVLSGPPAGVHRYLTEILRHAPFERLQPDGPLLGWKGHAWEQRLGRRADGRLLWSPSNTGPWAYRRQVVTIHDLAFFDMPGSQSRLFQGWYRELIPRLARRVDAIISVSEFTKSQIIARFRVPAEKVHVIPNGVDHAAFNAAGRAPEKVVATVGTLEPRKNIAALVQAWAGSQFQRTGYELAVVGAKGSRRVFADVDLPTVPGVRLLDKVSDAGLAALYRRSALTVMPSKYEGFGLPALEAMACGSPVLYNRIPAFKELVGDAGAAVDATDVQALRSALDDLAQDEGRLAELGRRGLLRAASFSWQRTADATATLLRARAEATA